MKILLFDNKTTGHHLSYADFFIKYLKEKHQKATFITKLDRRSKNLNKKLKESIKYLPHKETYQKKGLLQFASNFIEDYQDLNRTLKYAIRNKFDVLHLLCIDQSELASFLVLFLHKKIVKKIPVIASLHKEYSHFKNNNLSGFLKNLYVKLVSWCLRYLLKKNYLSYLTVHTETTQEAISKLLTKKSDLSLRKKMKLMPYPTRILFKTVSQNDARQYLGLPKNIPLLLFFGGMRTNKGIFTLLKSVKRVKDNFYLLLIGGADPARQKEIKKIIDQYHISQKVITRFDYVSEKEADYYFIASDLVLLPYHEHKSQSGPLPQACAAGKPIIGSDTGFIGYALKKYSLGQIVRAKSANSLSQAIKAFLGRIKNSSPYPFNKNGLAYAQKNHWRKTGQIALRLYQEALKKSYDK